ncbi:hypothetical protein GGI07_000471 [Coemansia sp. Benny D115]|nr:hypothetical protein GGI07_000471 [Coemansia sp. Benny D115]
MKWSVQIVRPNTHNVGSTTVLAHFPTGRYLFNCSEGTQRLSFEKSVRLSKLSAIFLTKVDWNTMGGLPGMLLTLADAGAKNFTISGGHNLTHAMAATRHFILRNQLGVSVNEMRDGTAAVFQDENLRVDAVHIYPDAYQRLPEELGPNESEESRIRSMLVTRAFGKQMPQSTTHAERKKIRQAAGQQPKRGNYGKVCAGAMAEENTQQQPEKDGAADNANPESSAKKRSRSPDHNSKQENISDMALPKSTPTPAALCYIAQGPEIPGKFDLDAAMALGLKPGPQYGKLIRGESVTTPDGTVIHPSQCVGPTRQSGVFIIIDCPDTSYIESLTTNPRFAPYQTTTSNEGDKDLQERLLLVIHSLGPRVALDERYKEWAAKFPAHVQHLVSSPEYVPDENPFQRHQRVQAAMAAVDSKTFVFPQRTDSAELPIDSFLQDRNVIVPSPLMTYDIEPKPMFTTPNPPATQAQSDSKYPVYAKNEQQVSYENDLQEKSGSAVTGGQRNELAVCPIGTGSSVPSVYRNVSANIVSVQGYGGIVLDCGESTVAQLKRFLGYPKRNPHNTRIGLNYTDFVKSLRLLYISHLHADHHLGAILLLREWHELTKNMEEKPRLSILAPIRFRSWLVDYSGVEDLGMDRLDFISCHDIRIIPDPLDCLKSVMPPIRDYVQTKLANVKKSLGLTDIATCSVIHCPWAYGVSLTHESGWKLVYSGDTRPCSNLIALGRYGDKLPTILLHEATHSDDLYLDAVAKRHTTVSESVAMAIGMGAENLLMTHFSQRSIQLPYWAMQNVKQCGVSRFGNLYQYSMGDNTVAITDAAKEDIEGVVDDQEDVAEEEPLQNDT